MNAFIRNIGGSIGISLISTFIARFEQRHQTFLVANAHAGNSRFDAMIGGSSTVPDSGRNQFRGCHRTRRIAAFMG